MRGPAARRGVPAALLAATLGAVVLAPAAAAAPAGGVAVGPAAGTTGLGATVIVPFGERLAGRLVATTFSYDLEFHSDQVTYEGQAELRNLLAVLDVHPGGGGFRLSAGALINDNRVEGDAPVRDLLLDQGIPPPTGVELGRLHARASGSPVAPYAGLGWDGIRHGGWSFGFDLGAAWQGEPDVEVTLDTPVDLSQIPGGPALLDRFLAAEENDLEDELADYRVFPVVMLSLAYRF